MDMCSIDYEMPVFAHSPQPVGGFLASSNYAFKDFPRMPSQYPPRYCNWSRQLQHTGSADTISVSKPVPLNGAKYFAPPKRPCLVIRSSEDSSSSTSDDESSNCSSGAQSPTRNKKRVRVMTEPSSVPPLWMNFHFLEDVTRGVDADPGVGTEDRWQITFAQPASDYVEFRKRLDEGKVSLENVIIKESDDTLVGTVKVKNIAFEKEVFVRSSINNWQTHEDTYCSYVPNSSTTPASRCNYP
ncbi:unnamed protein product [Callosobruchus maculatus]|uniref:CBM21 domain-containing protein n=1 Tax=Callosobruchus maculatus TaxID=64391 RepID=A0A653CQ19_CALMS|nr:unnamed protein product [Callosobruchus maculatus]